MSDIAGAVLGGAVSGNPCVGTALVEGVRTRLGDAVRGLLAGPEGGAVLDEGPPGDPGWFGPQSATWQVHGELSMLVGGLRALLLQTLHPLAMAGVSQHSDYRSDPWGRLHRTSAFVATTTYGSTAEAEQAVEAVARVHERVRGIAPDGRPYRATDPDLVTWVHITEVDSFLKAYERYGQHPIDPVRADEYVDEMAIVAVRLGGRDVPRSRAELRDRLASFRPELSADRDAREAVRFLLFPPVPVLAAGPYAVISGAAIDLLPRFVRWKLWLPPTPGVDPLVVRPAARALLQGLGWALGPSPNAETARTRAGTNPSSR